MTPNFYAEVNIEIRSQKAIQSYSPDSVELEINFNLLPLFQGEAAPRYASLISKVNNTCPPTFLEYQAAYFPLVTKAKRVSTDSASTIQHWLS